MKGEDLLEEDCSEARGVERFDGGDEARHFGESVDNDKDTVESFADGESFDEVHRDGIPRSFRNGKEAEMTVGLVVGRLSAAAFVARRDVCFDEFLELRPPVATFNVLERLGDAGVASEVMIMVNARDEKTEILDVGEVDGAVA